VQRGTQESYPEFVTRLAEEAGVEYPTAEEARRLDRKRKRKKRSLRKIVREREVSRGSRIAGKKRAAPPPKDSIG
jgi:hypothetical protein